MEEYKVGEVCDNSEEGFVKIRRIIGGVSVKSVSLLIKSE